MSKGRKCLAHIVFIQQKCLALWLLKSFCCIWLLRHIHEFLYNMLKQKLIILMDLERISVLYIYTCLESIQQHLFYFPFVTGGRQCRVKILSWSNLGSEHQVPNYSWVTKAVWNMLKLSLTLLRCTWPCSTKNRVPEFWSYSTIYQLSNRLPYMNVIKLLLFCFLGLIQWFGERENQVFVRWSSRRSRLLGMCQNQNQGKVRIQRYSAWSCGVRVWVCFVLFSDTGVSKDIRCYLLLITRADVKPQAKWDVILVYALSHFYLPQRFMWVCAG